MEVRAGRPALPPFIERGAHPTLRQVARPPQPRAAAVTGAAMRTGLHMRDLLLLRGLECSPVLAMDSGNGKAWMTVSVPHLARSLCMRGTRLGALCSPDRARRCRACAGSPPRSLWQSALAG